MKKISPELVLRIGIFGEFLGHGVFAILGKASWLPYFATVGIAEPMARVLLPIIGIIDIAVALTILFKPLRVVLVWAAFWGFLTALIRPLSGEPIWDFVERWANWAAPLALLLIKGWPKKGKGWLS